jgi:AcrR family transcriptional regulator
MKVSKAQAAENREGIVDAAARLYREKGLDGVGVAEITRDAGLTHGGLYRHFESKDALAREACLRAFEWTITPLDGLESSEADGAPAPDSARWCMAIFLRRIAITPERAAPLRHWQQMPQERGLRCRRFLPREWNAISSAL